MAKPLRGLLILALAVAAPTAPARDIFIEPDAPLVARVFGDTIRMRNPEDAKQAILVRLLDQYAREKGIVAEPAEVDAQARDIRGTLQSDRQKWNARLEAIERRLRERSLGQAERKSLSAERNTLKTLLGDAPPGTPAIAPLEDDRIVRTLASGAVRQWKIDRALYQQYGGRIAAHPGGPEPHDAYRRFLEERSARQDFQIFSPELEQAFRQRYAVDAPYRFLRTGSPEEASAFAAPPWQHAAPKAGG
jgi:hypothetical protein